MSAGGVRRVFLFDEVQKLYKDRGGRRRAFWEWAKACAVTEKGENSLTSILMAAAYGDKRSDFRGAGSDSPVSTPLDLVDEQLVSLAPWTPKSGSLQLTDNEWAELWDAFLRQTRIPLTAAVQDFIWSICGGQVSCVTVARLLIVFHLVSGTSLLCSVGICLLLVAFARCDRALRQGRIPSKLLDISVCR